MLAGENRPEHGHQAERGFAAAARHRHGQRLVVADHTLDLRDDAQVVLAPGQREQVREIGLAEELEVPVRARPAGGVRDPGQRGNILAGQRDDCGSASGRDPSAADMPRACASLRRLRRHGLTLGLRLWQFVKMLLHDVQQQSKGRGCVLHASLRAGGGQRVQQPVILREPVDPRAVRGARGGLEDLRQHRLLRDRPPAAGTRW